VPPAWPNWATQATDEPGDGFAESDSGAEASWLSDALEEGG